MAPVFTWEDSDAIGDAFGHLLGAVMYPPVDGGRDHVDQAEDEMVAAGLSEREVGCLFIAATWVANHQAKIGLS